MGSITPQDWVAFLEKRVEGWNTSLTLAVAGIGAVAATATFFQSSLGFKGGSTAAYIIAAIAAASVAGILMYALSRTEKRRRTLFLLTLVLTGTLRTNSAIAWAYHYLVG
jgi:ABC-type Fe3+-siderophore transport system permease subunit